MQQMWREIGGGCGRASHKFFSNIFNGMQYLGYPFPASALVASYNGNSRRDYSGDFREWAGNGDALECGARPHTFFGFSNRPKTAWDWRWLYANGSGRSCRMGNEFVTIGRRFIFLVSGSIFLGICSKKTETGAAVCSFFVGGMSGQPGIFVII